MEDTLESIDLEINKTKTKITDFNKGFHYLGYLFCRSLILEKKKKTGAVPAMDTNTRQGINALKEIDLNKIPAESWLSCVDFKNIKQLKKSGTSGQIAIRPLPVPPDQQLPLYITDPTACVRLTGESLCVHYTGDENKEKRRIPAAFINSLIISGRTRVTLPVILKLAKKGVPSFFCTKTGKVYASIPVNSTDISLRVKQLTLASDEMFILYFAQKIVSAKINNYAVLIRRQKWDDGVVSALKTLENSVMNTDTLDAVRGYEGKAASLYFNLLAGHLEPGWRFSHRKKHPPPDPVNAILSFGYTILYHRLTTALLAAGLDPGTGFFHKQTAHMMALACDLEEEFRHLIDSTVLYMIHRGMVKPGGFIYDKKSIYPCLMKHEAKKTFIVQVEKRLCAFITLENGKKQVSYKELFSLQAEQVKQFICGRSSEYKPYRIR